VDWLSIVLLAVVFLGLLYVVYYMRMGMAYVRVIKTMKRYNAVGRENAKSIEDLGLLPASIVREMWTGRDYTDTAIMELLKKQIIGRTEKGNIYLVQEKLAESKWKNL
jgi:hypothetical protein